MYSSNPSNESEHSVYFLMGKLYMQVCSLPRTVGLNSLILNL